MGNTTEKMKAAIYNPYLDTLGGGERYTMAFAKVLSNHGYQVDVQWRDTSIKKRLEVRFGVDLNGVNFVKEIGRGDGYEICFWVSDGSIPLLRARHNFLHFQMPFKGVNGRSIINKMKLFRIEKIICNSYFTKGFIDDEYGVDSAVVYPPVEISKFKRQKKENVILSVARFSQLTQAKRQNVLIDVFKKLNKFGIKNWRFILAGGVEIGANSYVATLRKLSKNYPIQIIESPTFDELIELYSKAKIFWTASGFGISEKRDPAKVEHFGISLVESMASGCVAFAYSAGGHKEIITDKVNGFLWKSKSELNKKTRLLIKSPEIMSKMAHQAKSDSNIYEFERFTQEVLGLL